MDLTIKINNETFIDSSIVIIDDHPTFSWSFPDLDEVVIDGDDGLIDNTVLIQQSYFELWIGDSTVNWGTSAFLINIVRTRVIYTKNRFWVYTGSNLERGKSYYGQIRVVDDIGRKTGWIIFSFN